MDFRAILTTFARHDVKFIVVGGVAAGMQGAFYATLDVDLVHATDADNVRRVLAALEELEAHYRHRPELRPQASHLSGAGHQLLFTRYGPLDLLGAIGNQRTYEDLLPLTDEMEIGSTRIRVLRLDTLIDVKSETSGDKDRAVLPLLRRVLEERRRSRQ
jgi:hypothetical protein